MNVVVKHRVGHYLVEKLRFFNLFSIICYYLFILEIIKMNK